MELIAELCAADVVNHAASPGRQHGTENLQAVLEFSRTAALDCQFESICERCGFFETGPEFIPILRRQRDDAGGRGDTARADLFDGLLSDITDDRPSSSFS
ncbi:MAG: hypothetical protein LC808_00060 [Actinobacteria bacterium]|nr:hypothetical protein [Actinomycetota bacterium]